MSAKFIDELYDWKLEDVEKYIQDNSENNFLYIFYAWNQIGRDKEWYKLQCREMAGDLLKIRREIDCEWVLGSEMTVFSLSDVRRAKEACNEPIGKVYLLDNKSYILNIYKEFDFSNPVLIGVDIASGEYKDSSAITVADSSTLEVIGVFANNTIDSNTLGQCCYFLLTRIFPNGILVPEANNEGKAMINFLIKTEIRNKIYFEYKTIIGEEKTLDGSRISSNTVKRKTRVYGVNTNTKTRPLMIDLIRPALEEEPEYFHCKEIIDQISGLERKKTGKIEHSDSGNDDILFSYLMCRYVWAYGTNLHQWNITKGRKFTNLGNPNITFEELEANRNMVQHLNKTIDDELDTSIELMGLNSDSTISEFYQREMYHSNLRQEAREIKNRQKEFELEPEKKVTTTGIEWNSDKNKKIYVSSDKDLFNETAENKFKALFID